MGQQNSSRRDFLKTAGAGAFALAAPAVIGAGRTDRRPNILFCLSDDQSYPHAGAYGCGMTSTPAFDRVAGEGVLFSNAYVNVPSCCPSRATALTGQPFYRLKEGSQNWAGGLRKSYATYTGLLAEQGYAVGSTGKGMAPTGKAKNSGRMQKTPAGRRYNKRKTKPPAKGMSSVDYAANFRDFLGDRKDGQPFCFWFGATEPHRAYEEGSGLRAGKKLAEAEVPGFLPDIDPVRKDVLDYALEIEWFDTHLQRMMDMLEEAGELENTLILVTGDNGMPFPRAKTTMYDSGTRVPLAVRWGDRVPGGRTVDDFVSFIDFAPTFVEAAGGTPPEQMLGSSLVPLLTSRESGRVEPERDHVLAGRERHHPGAESFPARAIRTDRYLYIRNYKPGHSWGGRMRGEFDPGEYDDYRDVDPCISKRVMLQPKNRRRFHHLYQMAFGPRPAEEFYDVQADPHQLHNLAPIPGHEQVMRRLRRRLRRELKETGDPRALGRGEVFDEYFNKEWLQQRFG